MENEYKSALNVLKYMAFAIAMSACSHKLPHVVASDECTAAHGGSPSACWTALHLDTPRPAKGASYHSAGTMILAAATCVNPGSQFWFHGAHIENTQIMNAEGNEELMSAYRRRYPAVAEYLEDHGSLQTTRWTKLSGRDLNKLGVPLCKAQS
jgi:hypothetical protein